MLSLLSLSRRTVQSACIATRLCRGVIVQPRRVYCTSNNSTNNSNNNNNNDKNNNQQPTQPQPQQPQLPQPKQNLHGIILVEKSVSDKTYRQFYFNENVQPSDNKPQSNDGKSRVVLFLRDCFLPENYPYSVEKSYSKYMAWQFLQNLVGSTGYVLATHACLISVGVGAPTSEAVTPVLTTINWLLREGVGSIGLLLYAGKYATKLDAEVKRSKFRGDILHNVGVGIEILTPLFPGKFLLMASFGNILKSIAGLILGSTKASFNKMFSLQENMADVTAKYQSQGLVAYLAGMMIGIGLTKAIPTAGYGHFGVFLGLAAVHLWASVQGLQHLTLNTLNEQRLNIVLEEYYKETKMISPVQVKEFERLLLPKIATERPAIVLGATVQETFPDIDRLKTAIAAFKDENHLINFQKGQFLVVLHDGITQMEQMRAYFQAYYLKATLFTISKIDEKLKSQEDLEWLSRVDSWRKQNLHVYEKSERIALFPPGWIERSLDFTKRNFETFVLRLEVAGWTMANIPLLTKDYRSSWHNKM